MAAKLTALLPDERFEGVVPVPSTRKERRRRGYDVPLLLARALSEALAIPLWDDILVKEFETKRQHELPLAERKGNLLGAFGLRGDAALSGRRVLLCDDVATSRRDAGRVREDAQGGRRGCGVGRGVRVHTAARGAESEREGAKAWRRMTSGSTSAPPRW